MDGSDLSIIDSNDRRHHKGKAGNLFSRAGEVSEKINASRKSQDTDDPLEVLLYDPIAIRLTHGFIRAGWSANTATFLSMLFGLAGAALLYPRSHWINLSGMALIIFSAILDCCDGQIARLTHTSSQLGRVLDGMADGIIYLAIYAAVGLRTAGELIPFTQRPWSFYMGILVLAAMLCHAGQSRMADYYRGLHLFFLKGKNRADLCRSKDLEAEIASLPADAPAFERLYRSFYLPYTRNQEKHTPNAQKLLDKLEEQQAWLPRASETYIPLSRRYIQLVSVLSFNLRTYVLFLLLLLGLQLFFFPFVILILEGVKWFMVARYERIARQVYEKIP